MKQRLFRFKQFAVEHNRSAMKVGVDGVLIGAWADLTDARRLIDVGCGCGLIALMCAQRLPALEAIGVDTDMPSIEEARLNASHSPWADRVSFIHDSFLHLTPQETGTFDRIISNPPFFAAGVSDINSARLASRHVAELSPKAVITHGCSMLNDHGKIALIAPATMAAELTSVGNDCGLTLHRMTLVKGLPHLTAKRVMLEFGKATTLTTMSELILEHTPGNPTADYLALCHDFYLRF